MQPVIDETSSRAGRELLEWLATGFAPPRAKGVHAVVEWQIEAATGQERVQMQIDDGAWGLAEDYREPSLTVGLCLSDLSDLVAGRADATDLFLRQRLTVSGDFLLAARLPHFLSNRRPR